MSAVACGGDDGGSGLTFVDAGDNDGGGTGTCNPVNQTDCAEDEKCASVVVQESPPIVQTLCVEAGPQAEGEACESGPAGPTTGYDNCQAFLECVFGECRPACQQVGATAAGTCEDGFVCQIFNGLYEDLPTDDFGICIPSCDPVDGAAGDDTDGIQRDGADVTVNYAPECGSLQCYMNLFDGIGVCSGSFEGAPDHDQDCGDSCALNGCVPGAGPFMPGGNLSQWQEETLFFANTVFGLLDVCIRYCSTDEWTAIPGEGTATDFEGNCPPASQCWKLTGSYLNFDEPNYAPDNWGICIAATRNFGTCADHVADDLAAYLTEEGQEPVAVPPENNYRYGCMTGQEIFDKINELSAATVGMEEKKRILQRINDERVRRMESTSELRE